MLRKISTSIALTTVIAAGVITATLAAGSTNVSKETSQTSDLTPNAASPTPTFADVSTNEWYFEAVSEAIKKKYVEGYKDGLFHPDSSVTRAEFLKMIVTSQGKKIAGAGEWYEPYVAAAVDGGFYKLEDFNGSLLAKVC